MPNHVHLILTPSDDAGLGRAVGERHRRYTAFVNARARWAGHLFDGRYASVAMDEAHLIAAVRYVSLNPVRAGLVARADDWTWSSVRAHRAGANDGWVEVRPVLDRVEDFAALVSADPEIDARHTGQVQALRTSERTGRPLGARDFVNDLERRLRRPLARRGAERRPSLAVSPDQPHCCEPRGTDNLSPNSSKFHSLNLQRVGALGTAPALLLRSPAGRVTS